MRVVALARICAATVLVCRCVVRSDLYGLGVVGYCTVDIARQSVPRCTVRISGRVVGSPLNDFRAAFDPKLRVFTLEAVLLVVCQDG